MNAKDNSRTSFIMTARNMNASYLIEKMLDTIK